MIINKENNDYIYYWVGKNIAKQRKLKGWTQRELAERCNFNNTFISNIENNSSQTFSMNTFYHISKILGLNFIFKTIKINVFCCLMSNRYDTICNYRSHNIFKSVF